MASETFITKPSRWSKGPRRLGTAGSPGADGYVCVGLEVVED